MPGEGIVTAATAATELADESAAVQVPRATDEVVAYAQLKRDLVARAPGDRLAYVEGKDAYVAALERRALAWSRP